MLANRDLTSFANELQQFLGIPVIVANFVEHGAFTTPLPSPCSAVGVQPFCAGGSRKLVLNAASPLVVHCAALCDAHAAPAERFAAFSLGKAMMETSNWPMPELDSPIPTNAWNRILSSGPMKFHICPLQLIPAFVKVNGFASFVLNYERVLGRFLIHSKDMKTEHESVETLRGRLSARDDALRLELNHLLRRADSNQEHADQDVARILSPVSPDSSFSQPRQSVTLVLQKKQPSFSSMVRLPSFFSRSTPKLLRADSSAQERSERSDTQAASSFRAPPSPSSSDVAHNDQPPFAIAEDGCVLTYSPMLPVLLRAIALGFAPHSPSSDKTAAGPGIVPLSQRFSSAFWELGSEDRLFCLSLWFRIPLIDRTGILQGPIKVALGEEHARPMVTRAEVEAFKASGETLEGACRARARFLWEESEVDGCAMDIQVAWSGGIDSTSALVSLMVTAKEKPGRWERLVVILDNESISEYPLFYEKFIVGSEPPLRELRGEGRSLASLAALPQRLTVTGELGDQLFGSDKTKQAFLPEVDVLRLTGAGDVQTLQNAMTGEDIPNFFAQGLDAPWQDTLLPSLRNDGLLCGSMRQWEDWIRPHLDRSPVPIKSTFDMLWWLNFSCKWRQVSLRCIHDVGPIPASIAGQAVPRDAAPGSVAAVLGGFRHFFDDQQLECWACVPENHERKYADRTDWTSYKEPLKQVILAFTGDAEYFANKTKVGSLFREEESTAFSAAQLAILAGSGHVVRWGALSLCSRLALQRYGQTLVHLLPGHRWGEAIESRDDPRWRFAPTPQHARDVLVNPWSSPWLEPAPFDLAPAFAETDERQARRSNPVTKVTLEGKCAALLPASLVRGRTVLDLGACLGAMCHYALCAGAAEAVAVEAQVELCERARQLLRQHWREASAASLDAPSEIQQGGPGAGRFRVEHSGIQEFLASCADAQYDVVVCAGVLHCFTNPVQVVVEIARVAKVAVVIESSHPHVVSQGGIPDQLPASAPTHGGMGLLQVTANSRCNLAGEELSLTGLAVWPSRQLIEELCRALGMRTVRVSLAPHPERPEDVLTYCGARRLCATPMRFFLRCYHVGRDSTPRALRTLEDQVLSGEGKVTTWTGAGRMENTFDEIGTDWRPHTAALRGEGAAAESKDPAAGCEAEGSWAFNADVARNFDAIAQKHIPDYTQVIQLAVQLLWDRFAPGEEAGGLSRLRVMDVGSATGNTLQALLGAGVGQVDGIDSSEHMNAIARQRLPASVRTRTAQRLEESDRFDALLVNWTAHFVVGEAERAEYLQHLVGGLVEGGMLMLTEKTAQSAAVQRMYAEWKRSQGVSEKEVRLKELQLRGVLEPLPMEWYEHVLRAAGLQGLSVRWSRFGFVTWVGFKGSGEVEGSRGQSRESARRRDERS